MVQQEKINTNNPLDLVPAANPALTLANLTAIDLQQPFKSVDATFSISMLNAVKIRRNILLTLDAARPLGAFDSLILSVIQAEHPNTTKEELCRELDHLVGRNLITVDHRPGGRPLCKLMGDCAMNNLEKINIQQALQAGE